MQKFPSFTTASFRKDFPFIFFIFLILLALVTRGCTQKAFAQTSTQTLAQASSPQTTPLASPETILFSDNFDSGDYSRWTVQRNAQYLDPSQPCTYIGSPASWTVLNNQLTMSIMGPACTTEITPNTLDLSQLPYGYEYAFDMIFKESIWQDRNALFLWKDKNNWYDLHFFGPTVWVQKVVNGGANNVQYFQYDFQPDVPYRLKFVVRSDHALLFYVNDQLMLQVEDALPYISGPYTVGLQASVGTGVFTSDTAFDNVVVSALASLYPSSSPTASPTPSAAPIDGKQLNVSRFKQNDPLWKSEIYDTATTWSNKPTIERWGCAMTSLVMIMKYYQIDKFPDGTPITPSTLNTWLKNQPDGYTAAGLVNWGAVMRLTRLVYEKYGGNKLEYARISGSSTINIEAAKKEIRADRPVILNIPGHFLVGDGVPADDSSLSIKDPLYNYTTFAQHHTTLESVRTFHPSHTDLSYLHFEYSDQLQVVVKDANGQPVSALGTVSATEPISGPESVATPESTSALQPFSDYTSDQTDGSGERTPQVLQQEWSKPLSGTYTIEVSQATPSSTASSGSTASTLPSPYRIDISTYDVQANPTLFHQEGFVGTTPLQLVLTYNRDGQSQLRPKVDFLQYQRDLKMMYDLKHIKRASTYLEMNRIALLGSFAVTKDQQRRYITLLRTMLVQAGVAVDVTGKQFLDQELKVLEELTK